MASDLASSGIFDRSMLMISRSYRSEKGNEMRISLLLLAVGVCVIPTGVKTQDHTITAVATVKQLCEGMITASSDAIFNVGRDVPSNDEEWLAVHNSALMLAESGNLLMIGGRARDAAEWMEMSHELVDAGVAAVKAVEARDVDGLLGAGDQIVVVCEKCHEPYRDGGLSMPIR